MLIGLLATFAAYLMLAPGVQSALPQRLRAGSLWPIAERIGFIRIAYFTIYGSRVYRFSRLRRQAGRACAVCAILHLLSSSVAWSDSGTGNLLLDCSSKGTCQKREFLDKRDRTRKGHFDPRRNTSTGLSAHQQGVRSQVINHHQAQLRPLSRGRTATLGGGLPIGASAPPQGAFASLANQLREAKIGADSHEFYYRDTQGYSTLKSEAALNLWVSKFEFSLLNRRADAWGPTGYRHLEEVLSSVSTNLSENASIAGALGAASIAGSQLRLVGNLHSTVEVDHTWITAAIFRDTVNTTAETIGYRIVQNSAGIDVQRNLFHGLADHLKYDYSTFSDSNHANQLQNTLGYSLNLGPIVDSVGYRFGFADFARVTNHGYFTPQGLTSHELVEAAVFKRESYYAAAEVALGHRSFTTAGYPSSDLIASGNLSLGMFPTKHTFVEIRAEGGNYQVGLPSAWSYFMLGLNTSYVF